MTITAEDRKLAISFARRYAPRWYLDTEELEQEGLERMLRYPRDVTGDLRRLWVHQTVKQAGIQMVLARKRKYTSGQPVELDDPLNHVELRSAVPSADSQIYFAELLSVAKRHLSPGQYQAILMTIDGQDHLTASMRELLRQAHRRMAHWKETGKWISSTQVKKAA